MGRGVHSPILSAYRGRIPDAGEFARRNRVLLVDSFGGVPIDIALAGLPFEALAVERGSLYEFEPGCSLRTCSAEDLMVHKLFAFRTRDRADVESIVVRQRLRLELRREAAHPPGAAKGTERNHGSLPEAAGSLTKERTRIRTRIL